MTDPVEALPEDIARLLEREKSAYPVDPKARRALLSRVEMAIALGGGGLAGGGSSAPAVSGGSGGVVASVVKKGVAAKMVAVAVAAFVGGGITGGAVVDRLKRARALAAIEAAHQGSPNLPPPPPTVVPASPLPEPRASALVPAEPGVPLSSTRGSDTTRQGSSSDTSRQTSAANGASSARGDLVREREILDAARAALARGQAQDAITTLQEHARRWPNGELAAEREVVWIQSLVAAGRLPEAKARAARFHQTFPKSIFAPAIDAALGSAPATP
jgi:hypothetical protein